MLSQVSQNVLQISGEEGLQQTATFFFPNESMVIKSPPSIKQNANRSPMKPNDSNQNSKVNSPNETQRCRPVQYKVLSKKMPFQFPKETTFATSFQNLNDHQKKELQLSKKPISPYQEQGKLLVTGRINLKKQGSEGQEEAINNSLQRDSLYFRKFVQKKQTNGSDNSEKFILNTKAVENAIQKKFEQQKQYCEIKMKEIQEKMKGQIEPKKLTPIVQEKKILNIVPENYLNVKQLIKQPPKQIVNLKQFSSKQEDQVTSQLVLPKISYGISEHAKSQNLLYNSQKSSHSPPELSNQYGFPFRKNLEVDQPQDIRKAKTAQETLREQPISSKRTDIGLTSQDSQTSFPSVNSPAKGTVLGFGQRKSFLQRKPQAKIISRLFSSKSDNN